MTIKIEQVDLEAINSLFNIKKALTEKSSNLANRAQALEIERNNISQKNIDLQSDYESKIANIQVSYKNEISELRKSSSKEIKLLKEDKDKSIAEITNSNQKIISELEARIKYLEHTNKSMINRIRGIS